MYESQPLTSYEPKLKLVIEEKPPKGKRLYLVSLYGAGYIGDYHEDQGAVAWMPLPKLTKEQKALLEEMK